MRPGAALSSPTRRGVLFAAPRAHFASRVRHLLGAVALGLPVLLGGCTADEPPPAPTTTSDAASAPANEARAQLAALAAAAADRHLVASYTMTVAERPNRTVVVTHAADRTWRVDIPGGALGGTADISIVQTASGIFQCALQSPQRPEPTTCVRVAPPNGRIASKIDPRVQHLFTDWRSVLIDRQAPLAVSTSRPLPGTRGTCFSVDSTSASLAAPLDVGIYCYDADGTLTGVRVAFGTLVLAGTPSPAPPTVTLPGPVVDGEPLGMTAPPTPSASAEVSPTPAG
ncbi:hypothetical protein ACWDV4_04745 [Micromonospora sp. NPDC003197]